MKLRLTINGGSLVGQEFVLETGFLTVGRSDTCSVRFDPLTERIASKQHAFIEAKPDGFYVTDNNSTNGTLLNGERIDAAKLSNGDTIQFGKNGVTGTVLIEALPGAAVPESTVDRFNAFQASQYEQAAQYRPVSVQNSLSQLGLGNADVSLTPPPPRRGRKYIFAAIAIFVIIFLSLVASLLISLSLSEPGPHGEFRITLEGVGFAVLGSLVAFTPAVLYILPLAFLDRYDPEPLWLLALAFAWGALVAVIVSFIVNTLIGLGLAYEIGGNEGQAIGAITSMVISAPIFEEGSKGLGLILLLVFFRRYFDDILDGIVFAGVIALGFATVENVQYYGNAMRLGLVTGMGPVLLVITFVLRGVLSPFAHVTFTSMTGIGCGISRESHKTWVRILMPILGYGGAVVLHAFWNGMTLVTQMVAGVIGFLIGYAVLELPFFVIFVSFCGYIMYRQNRILKEMLAMDVARGLIPEDHARKATSAFRSTGWLISGIFGGKFFARSRYLRALGKLGLSYWHIQRATAAQGQTASFQQNPILRQEVVQWRDKV